jgi:hypothetical protein
MPYRFSSNVSQLVVRRVPLHEPPFIPRVPYLHVHVPEAHCGAPVCPPLQQVDLGFDVAEAEAQSTQPGEEVHDQPRTRLQMQGIFVQ